MGKASPLLGIFWCVELLGFLVYDYAQGGEQPLSRIAIHRATIAPQESASIVAFPTELGLKGETIEWVTGEFNSPNPAKDDWVGVFSRAKFKYCAC